MRWGGKHNVLQKINRKLAHALQVAVFAVDSSSEFFVLPSAAFQLKPCIFYQSRKHRGS